MTFKFSSRQRAAPTNALNNFQIETATAEVYGLILAAMAKALATAFRTKLA
jgi:hypothetical protein